MRPILILSILLFFIKSSYQYYKIDGNEACVNCIGKDRKVCKPDQYSTERFCCRLDEHSLNCGAGTYGECAQNQGYDPIGSEYLLCPNHEDCKGGDLTLYSNERTGNVRSVPKNGVCVMKVSNFRDDSNSIEFTHVSQWHSNGYIFSENDDSLGYTSQGSLMQREYQVRKYRSVLIVVIPQESDHADFSFRARAVVRRRGLTVGPIVGIVLGSSLCLIIFIMTICCCIKRRKAKLARNNEEQIVQDNNEPLNPEPENLEAPQEPENDQEVTRSTNSSIVAEPAEVQGDEENNIPEGVRIENPEPAPANTCINSTYSSTDMQAPSTDEPIMQPGQDSVIEASPTEVPVGLEYSINNAENNN